jgi:hypothetical protein
MGNHFHLAVQFQDPRRLSAFMAGLQRSYVHYFHRRRGFVGHLFQGRFKSPSIQLEGYLMSCGRYIERNPLAAEQALVQQPWDYPWSSCRYYALGEANAFRQVKMIAHEAIMKNGDLKTTLRSQSPWAACQKPADAGVNDTTKPTIEMGYVKCHQPPTLKRVCSASATACASGRCPWKRYAERMRGHGWGEWSYTLSFNRRKSRHETYELARTDQ